MRERQHWRRDDVRARQRGGLGDQKRPACPHVEYGELSCSSCFLEEVGIQ